MNHESENKRQYQTIPEVAVHRTRQSQPYKKEAEMPDTNTRGWFKILSSPLAGEDARRAGEGYQKENTYTSPSSGLRPPSPSEGRRLHGFTLIELLVVVLIIGILAAVAVPQYQKAVLKSRAAEALVNLRFLREEVEMYYMANGHYPTDITTAGIQAPSSKYSYYIGSNIYVSVAPSDYSYTLAYILDKGNWKNNRTPNSICSLTYRDDGTSSTGAKLCKTICGVSSLTTVWGSGEKGCRFNS